MSYKVAYISPINYPNPSATALATMHMAAAFAKETNDGNLFVGHVTGPEARIRYEYNIADSPVRFWSLHSKCWLGPINRLAKPSAWTRAKIYNSAIAAILTLNPAWRQPKEQRRICFIRTPMEAMYWGLFRSYFAHLRDWVFVFEMHDMVITTNDDGTRSSLRQNMRVQKAVLSFDLVTTVADGIAQDMESFSSGVVRPVVVPQATTISPLPTPPTVDMNRREGRITLGYVGTIDQMRGVDDLLRSLRFLPDHFRLRLVGRFRHGQPGEAPPRWFTSLLSDPAIGHKVDLVSHVPLSDAADQIDAADIVIQPAGLNDMYSRYAAPLKLLNYMARGKPIVAACVPSHLAYLQDGVNSRMYRAGDPEDLAACVMSIVEQPRLADQISNAAWKQSANHTYSSRARHVLRLVEEVYERRDTRSPD